MAFFGPPPRSCPPASASPAPRRPKSLIVLSLIDAFVLGVIAFSLWTSHERDYDKTVATLDSLSRSMDVNLARLIDKIDLTLRVAVDEAERETASGAISRATFDAFIARHDARLPEALGLLVSDARGHVIAASPNAEARDRDVSDHDYFIRQRDGPASGLVISSAFHGPIWKRPIIILSRRYRSADGSFAGIVAEAVSIESLSAILSSADVLGPGGLATIWDKRLGLVAQFSTTRSRLGVGAKPSPQLAALIGRDAGPTVYHHARRAFDNQERIAYFRKVHRWPFYLSLGLFQQDAMAKWRREAITLGGLGVVFLFASAWGFIVYTRYLNALRASETRYKGLFDHMQAGFSLREVILDEDGRPTDFRFLAVNNAYLAIFKLSAETVIGNTLKHVLSPRDGDLAAWVERYGRVVTTGEPAHFETFVSAQGVWLDIVAYRTEPGRIAVLAIDISDRKAAEARVRRLSMLYAALSQCNQAIVHCTTQEELFPLVCRAAVEFGGMSGAWIGLLDEETKRVNPVASHGIAPAQLERLQVSIDDSDPHGQGPTGCAIRSNRPFWSQDIARDDHLAPWRDLARNTKVASTGALPLSRRGKPIGNLTLYCDTINAFDGEVQRLLAEMASDVAFALDNFALEIERRQTDARINELAFFDQLTGLANRALLSDRIKQAIAAGMRGGGFNALLFLDLDNFKTINDTLGHERGDLLLKQVAARLTSLVRVGDTVARFGGDEFVLLLQGIAQAEAEAASNAETISKKILAALGEPIQLDGSFHRCTASIGVTLFGNQPTSADSLLKQADLAMYKAKDAGRNTVRFFDPIMQSSILDRISLERDMEDALRFGQFSLHYQPQIFGGHRIVGAEALLRWRHPVRGMIPPAEFIPLAEETGQILALGDWVLKTACTQVARWARHPRLANLTVAVNVSARQFRDPNFVENTLAIVRETGVDPRLIKLELTESLLVVSVQDIIDKMAALQGTGIRFSLDDFGTGYSSLAYLKRLPLEQLKIDQSFIRDLLTDPNDAAIAGTIVALAHSLGLEVIAEGVETKAQWEFLVDLGCHAYQGYLFSRPLEPKTLERMVVSGALEGTLAAMWESPGP